VCQNGRADGSQSRNLLGFEKFFHALELGPETVFGQAPGVHCVDDAINK
jgi:hypothetical protein